MNDNLIVTRLNIYDILIILLMVTFLEYLIIFVILPSNPCFFVLLLGNAVKESNRGPLEYSKELDSFRIKQKIGIE